MCPAILWIPQCKLTKTMADVMPYVVKADGVPLADVIAIWFYALLRYSGDTKERRQS